MLSFLKYVQNICTWITFTWCWSINALLCSVVLCEVSFGSFIGASVDSLCVCFIHERSGNVYHNMKSMSPLGYYVDAIMKTRTLQLQRKKVELLIPPKNLFDKWKHWFYVQLMHKISRQILVVGSQYKLPGLSINFDHS